MDLSNAILNAIESGPTNTPYECLGSNTGYSVREVLQTMQEVTGKKLNIIEAPRREGDAVSSPIWIWFIKQDNAIDICEI